MVVKLSDFSSLSTPKFESSVILYGSEATNMSKPTSDMFESSVISYGSEAKILQS